MLLWYYYMRYHINLETCYRLISGATCTVKKPRYLESIHNYMLSITWLHFEDYSVSRQSYTAQILVSSGHQYLQLIDS